MNNLKIMDVPVVVDPSAAVTPTILALSTIWLNAEQPLAVRLRRGLFAALIYAIVDLVHSIGHIYTARRANAPVSRLHVAFPFPKTIYDDNNVSPNTHRTRAIGGPIFSLLATLIALFLRPLTATNSIAREWLDMSATIHGLIGLGSFMPLPFLDGGSLLKWTQVEQGRTPDAADAVVEETNLFIGGSLTLMALLLLLLRYWKSAIVVLGHGLLFIGAGLGKIKG